MNAHSRAELQWSALNRNKTKTQMPRSASFLAKLEVQNEKLLPDQAVSSVNCEHKGKHVNIKTKTGTNSDYGYEHETGLNTGNDNTRPDAELSASRTVKR